MLLPIIPPAGLVVTLDYNGDYADVNIFTAAGSPTKDTKVIVNMATGTDFYASTTGNYACDCNGFTSGSEVIFNMTNSNITGQRGAGGAGGVYDAVGSPGGAGGTALRLGCPTTFNETGTSAIRGGGGGGGGGGGARGGSSLTDEFGCSCTRADVSTGGAGGAGQNYNTAAVSGAVATTDNNATGGTGGTGGNFGTAGSAGGTGVGFDSGCGGCPTNNMAGGAGGAAGDSIKTQSHSYTLNGVATSGSIVA